MKLAYIASRYGFPLAFTFLIIGKYLLRCLIPVFSFGCFEYRPNIAYTIEQYLGKRICEFVRVRAR